MTPTRNVVTILAEGLKPLHRESRSFAYSDKRLYIWLELDSKALDSTIDQMFDEKGFEPYTMLEIELDTSTQFIIDDCMVGHIAAYIETEIAPSKIKVLGDALNYC